MNIGDYNLGAIVVAAGVAIAIGMVWFAPPVLGARWQAATGITQREAGGRTGIAGRLSPSGVSPSASTSTARISVSTRTLHLVEPGHRHRRRPRS